MNDKEPGTRIYRAVVALVTAIGAFSCAGDLEPGAIEPSTSTSTQRSDVGALTDCTDIVFEDLKKLHDAGIMPMPSRPPINEETRAEIIQASTEWAKANCYIPCTFEMCASILQDNDGRIGVYIRPLTPMAGTYYPEAEITFDPGTLELVDSYRYHTGCVEWTETCRPKGS